MPEFAPSRQFLPTLITCFPPPDMVPMIEAPPPMSVPSPTTTPELIRPSTIARPRVPALKPQKPSAVRMVPGARWAPSQTRSALDMLTPLGTT